MFPSMWPWMISHSPEPDRPDAIVGPLFFPVISVQSLTCQILLEPAMVMLCFRISLTTARGFDRMNNPIHAIDRELLEAEKRIHERFEWLHIANDYISALLFLVGSVMFLWEDWQKTATWFFIVGSVFFLFAPILRTLNKRYVRSFRKGPIHW